MDLTWFYISGYLLLLLVTGYLLPFTRKKRIARYCAWAIAIVTLCVSIFVTAEQTPLLRTFVIVFLQLLSMKIVVASESYTGDNQLTFFQWIAFSLGWFGMRPVLFERLPSSALPYMQLALKGTTRIFIGFFLLYLSLVLEAYPHALRFFLPQLLLLIGLSLILHFGILNLSASGWRMLGVDVQELFRAPYRSKSLKEFWGRRWNLAFSEMTALIVYRPLKTKIGVEKAMAISFLFSGLLHEIAISLPVRAGYGLPMLYFVVHAAAMHLEARSSLVQKIVQHASFRHVWVMSLLILPMPLLFHTNFVQHVLMPLRNLILQTVGVV